MNSNPISLLIVEDDPSTQTMYKFLFGKHLELTIVSNVEDSIEHLSKNQVDLALIDLSLDGESDGLHLIRYMKMDPVLQAIPVAAITAHAFSNDRQNALDAGCDKFMVKPANHGEILAWIEQNKPQG